MVRRSTVRSCVSARVRHGRYTARLARAVASAFDGNRRPCNAYGGLAGATLGYDFGQIRLEADYAYRNIGFPNVARLQTLRFGEVLVRFEDDADVHTTFANAAFDQPIAGPLEAYALGGAGAAFVDGMGDAESAFAYQAGGGLTIRPSRAVAFDMGYRYMRTEDLDIGEPLETHNAAFSLRLYF